MKVSELSATLAKVQQIAGDIDVVFRASGSTDESVATDLVLYLDPATGAADDSLVIEYGPAPAAEPTPEPAPAEPAA